MNLTNFKKWIPGVAALILILIIITFYFFNQRQKDTSFCKEKCVYSSLGKLYKYKGSGGGLSQIAIGRDFPTQKECIDYCLIQVNK
jgi:preprotein translocase subunit YajC